MYELQQKLDVEEAVQELEEASKEIVPENINDWLREHQRRTISSQRIDDILIDLGYYFEL